jgi:hypothetical protein
MGRPPLMALLGIWSALVCEFFTATARRRNECATSERIFFGPHSVAFPVAPLRRGGGRTGRHLWPAFYLRNIAFVETTANGKWTSE